MLIPKKILEGIAAGSVTLAYRRWDRPRVLAGTRQRTIIGLLAIDAIEQVDPAAITHKDARAAGSASADELRAVLDKRAGPDVPTFRIELRPGGADPRIALRNDARLTKDDVAELNKRLARLDRASTHGPWTKATLDLIAKHPEVRAPDLAASVGRETQPFKRDVRKLKELGLTESLRIGYRISPRGKAFMKRG